MRNFTLILLLMTVFQLAAKPVKESTRSGDFLVAANWNPQLPPTGGEEIIIRAGHIMNVSNSWTPSSAVDLVVYGTLQFSQNGKKLNLPAGSTVTIMDGGAVKDINNDNSNRINIDGAVVYNGTMGMVEGPVTTNGVAPLPVTFASVNVSVEALTVIINWSTATEINNERFEVERSTDGVQFYAIGTRKGLMHSETLQTYSLEDKQPVNGTVYYRIKQIDVDGAFSYSKVVKVKVQIISSLHFPNPATPGFMLSSSSDQLFQVRVLDLSGRELFQTQVRSGEVIAEVDMLNSGQYVLQVAQQDELILNTILLK